MKTRFKTLANSIILNEMKSTPIESSILRMIQGSDTDSVSKGEIVSFLAQKFQKEPEEANKIISSLILKKDLIENPLGELEINRESGAIEAFGVPDTNDSDDQNDIPFREMNPIEDEDPEIGERISSMRRDDEDFYRSGDNSY